MKKILIFLSVLIFLTGCGKNDSTNVIKKLENKLKSSESYKLTATLDIYRNEEKYSYDVISSYKADSLFKVDLVNKNNNHEQIILKNDEGVYVLTPSLNKSFKFQSDWPYNNSQIYLLQPIITDLKNDTEVTIENNNDEYIIKSKVNYSTEKDFNFQKVYLDKDNCIYKVEIVDKNDTVKMSLNIISIEYNVSFDNDYFNIEKYQTTSKTDETISKIDDVVYPMYVPIDTYLTSQDVVETASGERVILTFSGESSFTIVQEVSNGEDLINYVYGDPYLILDTVGSLTDSSVSWISNGIEYSVISDNMNLDELLTVAQSISVKAVGK